MPGERLRTLNASLNDLAVTTAARWVTHAFLPLLGIIQLLHVMVAPRGAVLPATVRQAVRLEDLRPLLDIVLH